MEDIVLEEYSYTGITDIIYHPIFKDGKWYLVGVFPRPLSNVAHLCNIPSDEELILKLKYGG
jgi:hypothetical protein